MRRTALVLLAVPVLVLGTGCLRADVGIEVEDDGSGTLTLGVYPGPQLSQRLGLGRQQLQTISDALADAIPDSDVSVVTDEGDDGIRLTVPFDDQQTLVSQLLNLQTTAGQPVGLFRSLDISELDNGGWQLRAQVDVATAGATLATAFGSGQFQGALASLGTPSVKLTVELPGRIVTTNASDSDGGTATWDLDDTDLPPVLRMDTVPTGWEWTPVSVGLVGAAGLLVVGVALVLAGRGGTGTKRHAPPPPKRPGGRARRRRKAAAHGPPAEWAPPQVSTPPSSPQAWTSPPPYSSHPVGLAAPSPEELAGEGHTVVPSIMPDTPVATSGHWAPGPHHLPGATPGGPPGPPSLPKGFVPTPIAAFPETHGYSTPQPTEPGATGGSAEWSASVPPTSPFPRQGPPALPEGFVPTAATAFPETHRPGPPPGDAGDEPAVPPLAPAAPNEPDEDARP